MQVRSLLLAGIAGETLSNRETTKLGTGLWRCRDVDGGHWEPLADRLPPEVEVRAVAAHPVRPGTFFIGTQYGVHRSDDAGDSWSMLALPAPGYGVWAIAFHPHDPDVMLVGYEPGAIFRSEDGGHTWTEARYEASYPPGAAHEPKRMMSLAFDDRDPRHAFGAIEVGGLVRSRDGGRSWASVDVLGEVDRADVHAVAARDGLVVAATRIGILASEDLGETWHHVAGDWVDVVGLEPSELYAIVEELSRVRFQGNLFVSRQTPHGGAVRMELAARWPGRDDYGGGFDPRGVGGRPDAEGRQVAAVCWHALAAFIERVLSAHPSVRARTVLCEFDSVAAFREVAGAVADEPCACNVESTRVTPSAFSRIRRWMMADQYCRSLLIAPDDPRTIYVGAGCGYLSQTGALWCSNDGGGTWRALPLPDSVDSGLFGLASDGTRVFAATKDGQVHVSSDGGATWSTRALPAGADPIYALAVA